LLGRPELISGFGDYTIFVSYREKIQHPLSGFDFFFARCCRERFFSFVFRRGHKTDILFVRKRIFSFFLSPSPCFVAEDTDRQTDRH
jgi:hypothetical protein